nr:uncharacterized protein K02A2.6-like [Maniola hyperantus]
MSAEKFGILSTFDHSIHSWKSYKGRLLQWYIANDINATTDAAGIRRRAILLSALAEKSYQLAVDLALPKALEDVPFEEILDTLDAHFTPKRLGIGERHKFYVATQQASESHTEWAARLRGLTAHCNFSNVEEALRDRFVIGMRPGLEKEKLYAKDITELTLTKAVELAESIRCAHAGAASSSATGINASVVDEERGAMFKIEGTKSDKKNSASASASATKSKCSVCGFFHKSKICKYRNFVCNRCHVAGHLRRACPQIGYVATGGTAEDDDDDGKLYNIRSVKGEPMVESVCIRGVKIKFEIDSGSSVTVISEDTYTEHFSDIPLTKSNKRLISYTGDNILCVGMIRVPVSFDGRSRTLDVFVVRGGGPPLLGRDFISLFRLELTSVNYCKETENQVEKLQTQYPYIFSGRLGCFKKYKVSLTLKDDSKPVFFKARPLAFALRDKVNKEIDRLLELGVLEPVEHSEYASPIVPVLKRNGSVRLCADYSVSINKQLVIEKYPLPTVSELFSKLHGGQKFTKLDLSMAYNQFVLDEESQKITCINTHRGLYRYTRLVFGLASAPAIFQRAMESVLSGMNGVLCLLDDVLITGANDGEHLDRLHAVLQRLQEAGLTLQKEKCEFFKDEVSYLGYIINKDGLKKSPSKVKAILEASVPTNVNQLQSFLGLVNYYRSFVPSASTILSPLYDLLKKGVKWNWGQLHSKAFNTIKRLLASDQVLTHFNPNAKVILTVDASPSGLGAILSQIGSDGTEKPVAFASRTLSVAEKHYSQIQKEATAIIFGVRRFHQYLYGRADPFVLRTDHKPLISIFGPHKGIPEVSANRLQRYAMFLSGYNYTIEYVRSQDNSADYLSRASLPTPASGGSGPGAAEGSAGQCADAAAALHDRAAYVCFVIDGSLPVSLDELRKETEKDAILSRVSRYVLRGWPPKVNDIEIKPYYFCRMQLSLENGCLMRGHKVVIPGTLRAKVLSELHSSHLGMVKTKAECRSRFWFPGIDAAVENLIGTCNICQQLRPAAPRVPISPWEFPSHPFQRVHMDFLGPINGRTYLVIVDAYTKWVEVYDMVTTTTTAAVIEKLYEFMSRFGLMEFLITDNFASFCSQEFLKFCEVNGITHLTSPAYHPASNGQAESYVKIIKKGIKSSLMSSCSLKECKLKMLKYLLDYRNSVHSTTGSSPAHLVYGRKLRTRLDLINPMSSPPSSVALANFVKNRQYTQVKDRGGKVQKTFSLGDNVLYKKYSTNNKFIWCKGVIVKKLGRVVYLVKDCETLSVVKKHKNQMVLSKETISNNLDFWDDDNMGQQSASINVSMPTQPDGGGSNEEPATSPVSSGTSGSAGTAAAAQTPIAEPASVLEASDSTAASGAPATPPSPPAADIRSPDPSSRVTMTRGVRRPETSDDESREFFECIESGIRRPSARTRRRLLRQRLDN